ncbi:MAG: hypothetical protein JKY71_11545 [Alphaproteobacteria bacterium]|nr:hypothetical protein [Alphaproteobacteria bacterium]
MNWTTKTLATLAVLAIPMTGYAQVKSMMAVESVDSKYVVNDSSVIEYLLDDDHGPLKVYDFSTKQVYVKLSQNKEDQVFSVIPFTEMDATEIDFIRNIGCEKISLSDSFRRFCQ